MARLRKDYEPYSEVYKKGYAVGHSNVRTDTMTLRFHDELYEMPTGVATEVARWNGYFYEAKIEQLRALHARRKSNGEHHPLEE
jgi:hypothetical protein